MLTSVGLRLISVVRRGTSQHPHPPRGVNDDARRGHGQPVCPFLGEDLCAAEKRLWQADSACVVVAPRIKDDDCKAAFVGLKADICPVEVKPKIRIEPQRCIPGQDQQQFIEREDPGRQLMTVEKFVPILNDSSAPVHSVARQARRSFVIALLKVLRTVRNSLDLPRRADAVDAGDADRAEMACGTFELLEQPFVPARWQENILVQGHDPAMLGPLDS